MSQSHPSFTTIESIGREKIISRLSGRTPSKHSSITYGIGDDSAVIKTSDFKSVLLSSENYIEGVDFDMVISPLKHVGYKLASATLSDIYAMNGKPIALQINLGLSNKISVEMLDELYDGFDKACEEYDMAISGGDITATRGPMVIALSILGEADNEKIVYRSGAKIDDAICVTGDLGGTVAGLNILLREKQHFEDLQGDVMQPDLSDYEYVVRRQLVPFARRDLIEALEKMNEIPSAMIDISQGLVHEIMALTKASNVGAQLYEAALPISPETRLVADELKTDVNRFALYGGEDYEMLFTLPKDVVNNLYKHFDDFSIIGKIVKTNLGVTIQQAEGGVINLDEE